MTLPLELGGVHDPDTRRAFEQIAQQFPVAATGGGGGAPSGPAGGALSGTYPNPGLANLVVVDANVSATAAIARSKLDFGSGLVNADIAAAAAIAKTKLANLDVVNADVNAAAAIAESKLNLATDAAAGTGSRRTLGAGALQAASGTDARFTDSRAPNGSASGDLTGTYPGPTIAALAVTDAKVAAANKDGAAGTPSMRTLGTGAAQAVSGTDTRLSDSRAPNGAAGGALAGTYPNPTITGLPTGGSTGQVLTKNTATNYDTSWQTPAAGGTTATFVSIAKWGVT